MKLSIKQVKVEEKQVKIHAECENDHFSTKEARAKKIISLKAVWSTHLHPVPFFVVVFVCFNSDSFLILQSKYLSFYSQTNLFFTPHQGNFFLQRWRPLQKTITNKNTVRNPSLNDYSYKTLPLLKIWEHCEREKRSEEPEDQGVCCMIVSPSNVRGYIYEISPIQMHKHVGMVSIDMSTW